MDIFLDNLIENLSNESSVISFMNASNNTLIAYATHKSARLLCCEICAIFSTNKKTQKYVSRRTNLKKTENQKKTEIIPNTICA